MSILSANRLTDLTGKTILNNTGGILQVVQGVLTSTFSYSTAIGTFTNITGLSASITPSSTTNKILIHVSLGLSASGCDAIARLLRDSTVIGSGSGGTYNGIQIFANNDSGKIFSTGFMFLDNPSTTSTITYQVQGSQSSGGNQTVWVNRRVTDTASGQSSTITLFEVVG